MKEMLASRGHTKLSDEMQLKSVERKLPEDYREPRRSSKSFGNDISIDTGTSLRGVPPDHIKKTTNFEIEHR